MASSTTSDLPTVILLPGNGCTNIAKSNWYGWVASEIKKLGFPVVLENFPDPYEAKEAIWVPFVREELAKNSENVILIGHSSGAEATMRYLEKYKAVGAILVSACWTDLDEPSETISGYYSRPWLWSTIQANAQWILQFGSTDDPFIPIEEMRLVAKELSSTYIEYSSHGHFMTGKFPELLTEFKTKLNLN